MPTSELSDALNPHARHRQNLHEYSPQIQHTSYHPVVQPVQQHVPHVSDLELAIAPAQQPLQQPVIPRQIVAELISKINATHRVQQAEFQRRLTWEQEQEAILTHRQAEMEHRMSEMSAEIKTLRSTVLALTNNPSLAVPSTPNFRSPSISQLPTTPTSMQTTSPALSVAHPPFFHPQPLRTPVRDYPSPNHFLDHGISVQMQQHQERSFRVSMTPSGYGLLSPGTFPRVIESPGQTSPQSPTPGKRKKKRDRSSLDDDESSSSSSSYVSRRRRKRKNNHDTQCYTINHAMRVHILNMMELDHDKELPDSHPESAKLATSDPIRFVWDKTPKQSVHNGRMRTRVIEDIKENRKLYKRVPENDFKRKPLEAAFEQCFVTLRQKFKNQRDETCARNYKQREDAKARKARHLSRRKKLSNRSEIRNKISNFEHVVFDGALQQDCMSSEESGDDENPPSPQSTSFLRTRGYAWRSNRLLRFYEILDNEDRAEVNGKLKRGVGKRERREGPLKEEFVLPPEGVANWMISKRWLNASLATRPDIPMLLSKRITEVSDFDWPNFHDLGAESSEEQSNAQFHYYCPTNT